LAADDPLQVPVATAEDSIIAKLEWFQLGDESSQRQWDDVSRLVALHGGVFGLALMLLWWRDHAAVTHWPVPTRRRSA
jgi:hypothetical protein